MYCFLITIFLPKKNSHKLYTFLLTHFSRLAPEKPSKPEHYIVTQSTVTRPQTINSRPPSATRPPPANIITMSTKAPLQLATKPTISSLVTSNSIEEGKYRTIDDDHQRNMMFLPQYIYRHWRHFTKIQGLQN